MGLMWIALAVAAQQKRQQMYSSRNKGSKNNKSRHSIYNHSEDSYQPKHSYYDCVVEETYEKDSKLGEFFEMLLDEYKMDLEKKRKMIEDKRTDLIQKLGTPNLDKLSNELSKIGIIVKSNLNTENNYYNIAQIYIKGIGVIDVRGLKDNQIILEFEKMLEIEKENKLNYENEINELTFEIEKSNRRMKYTIFNRKEKNCQIENSKRKLEELRNQYLNCTNKITILEKLISLDESKKQLLQKSIEEVQNEANIRRKMNDIRLELLHFDEKYINYYDTKDNYIMETFERLVREGKITEATLEKVFLLLDKVEIKGRRGEYSFNHYSRYGCTKLENVIIWFVKNVYEADEKFIERNYCIDEEENPKTKSL